MVNMIKRFFIELVLLVALGFIVGGSYQMLTGKNAQLQPKVDTKLSMAAPFGE